MLHSAPNLYEKHLYQDSGRGRFYLLGTVSTLILFVGNALFVYNFPEVLPVTFVLLITVFYLILSLTVGILGGNFDFRAHRSLVAKWLPRSENATVDIFLPVCREDIKVIENTWNYVFDMVFVIHPNVKVHVLDDGKSDEVEALAKKFGFNYIRREGSFLKKAGNLRYAFTQTSGEFIIIFDADFCPRKDFLIETLPYMFEDSAVGIVQTPQFFDVRPDQNWIRRGAGAVQELFYRLIQVNRNTFNAAICVGTNALYRREHLAPFGGTAPMDYSEDVHTGFQLLQNGQKVRYIPVNLALGECPDTLSQFFTQQYRWAMGSINLFFSDKFWKTKLTVMQRISYLTGMFYYMSTGLASVTYFLPSLFILIFYPEKIFWFSLFFSVPSFFFTVVYMRYWMKLPMNLDVLRVRQVSYFAHLFALRDFLMGTLEEWKPTGVKSASKRYETFSLLFTWLALSIPVVVFSLMFLRIYEGHSPLNFILLAFFTAFNALIVIPVIEDV